MTQSQTQNPHIPEGPDTAYDMNTTAECFEKLQQSKLFVLALGTSNLDNAGMGSRRYRIFGKAADVAKLMESA